MKKIFVFLLINLIHPLIAAAPDDPEKRAPKLPTVAYDHLGFLKRRIPHLSDAKSIAQSQALISRIDIMYGARLKENPLFYCLIKPLIIMEQDKSGYHMSFVMSDFRISFLQLYAEKINPPVFSYDEALEMIESHKGTIRYASFILGLSSISPLSVDFSRQVWKRIKVIDDAQLDVLDNVLGVLDLDQNLKLTHTENVFKQMFQEDNWNAAYWDRYILAITSKDDLVDSLLVERKR